ncbi:DMT family transporter [Pseudosulfitobacter koreensis]|uniref:DMT family transporter n=1 Tax=Pseudosulfitobacter koreensis TaxID=2968472 RepID=A0ABT1YYI9_9RHOB|nr:DMT family transporter [Pseudosulfitobacter koreense]MCR8825939.1 DMT family transporter [Pseudosulfitobacter koreense]
MDQDRPLLGIMLMLGFCIVAPMGDALAKVIGQSLSLGQLLWCRFMVQVLVLIPLVWLTGRHWKMRGRVLRLTFIRTLLHIAGIGGMFTALRYLPLADAVAIAFVMPFLMLLLGKFVLGEEVGSRRLIGCVVGFAGTLLVVQPSFADVGWPALWPIFVAVTFALFMLVTRQIAKQTDPVGLQAVSGAMAVAIMSPLLLLVPDDVAALAMRLPTGTETLLLVGIGLFGTLGHLMMTWSLRFAPAATLAPMQYLEIPFATAIGYAVFGDWPNGLAAVGILITVGAGLYVVFRERSVARAQMRVPPAA